MGWTKNSSGIVDATCDRCGNGIIGTREFIKDEEWTVLDDEKRSVCCGDCIGELEDDGMDCPECMNDMEVKTLIHMSTAGPKGVKCFVCGECGEKVAIAGRVEG